MKDFIPLYAKLVFVICYFFKRRYKFCVGESSGKQTVFLQIGIYTHK